MDEEQAYPDVINRVLNIVRDNFGATFKAYYEGDPIEIPRVNFPCIIVQKLATSVSVEDAPTGFDLLKEQIAIRVVFNKKTDISKSDDYDQTERNIRKIVEARDPTTQFFLKNTIMYALRTNISLGSSIRNQGVDITYGLNPRTDTLLTSEAQIEIVVTELVQVPNRV